MRITERASQNPTAATAVGAVALIVVAVALYLFQPWQLFVDTAVSEDFPTVAVAPSETEPTEDAVAVADDGGAGGAVAPEMVDETVPADEMEPDEEVTEQMPSGPLALSTGSFGDRSHPTSGTATVYELEDGTRTLRIEGLETDNGPDLFVYLSTASPDAPAGEYGVTPVDLGRLKGNIGDQNYDVPADVDLDAYTTVAIWCERFDVVFGTAGLSAT